MRAIANAVSKLIAFLLAGILVLALPVSLVVFNLGEFLFQPERMQRTAEAVFVESELVPASLEVITNLRAEEISQKIEETGEEQGLNLFNLIYSMEVDNWRQFRKAVLPDTYIASWINSTVEGFYSWLDSDQRVPDLGWNMVPVIELMQGPRGKDAVISFYESLPDCTDLQMEEMRTEPGDPLPRVKMVEELCKLSTYPHQEQIDVYMEVLQMVIDRTPQEYNPTRAVLEIEEGVRRPYTLKWQLRRMRLWSDLSLLAPLGLLFLILVFGVRSVSGLGQWWGIPLIGGSLISFVSALLFRPLWTGVLAERMPAAVPQTSVLYHQVIENSARLMAQVFNPLRLQSFLVLLVGLGLTVMGFVFKVGENNQSQS